MVRTPLQVSSQLRELAQEPNALRDDYLEGGAIEELEKTFATLLGKEACAFFPTGTLANNVALRVLCGDDHRVLCQADSHIYRDDSDMSVRLGGINLVPLSPGHSDFSLDELTNAFDLAASPPFPVKVGALSLESPVHRLHGELIPVPKIGAIAALAARHGVPMHLDAARLLLAPPSVDVKAYVQPFDTVFVSLYKYLGAPFGAVLLGSRERIAKAREYRHMYGGLICHGWVSALLALDGLKSLPATMLRAHTAAKQLITGLQASGKITWRENSNISVARQSG